MTQDLNALVLPPEAVAQLDKHDRNLVEAVQLIDQLGRIVRDMRLVDHRRITLGRVAAAADLHRDLYQILEAVRELTREPNK